jgi:hypothetical protein
MDLSCDLVLVVMAFVFGVAVAVVDVVNVVPVLGRFVGAVRAAVLVLGRSMLGRIVVLVVVAFVFRVAVAVVDVVDMVPMLDGHVAAVGPAVLVLRKCVFSMDFLSHHALLR